MGDLSSKIHMEARKILNSNHNIIVNQKIKSLVKYNLILIIHISHQIKAK
jgi:hypothetical protein